MPQTCRACHSPDRAAIDAAILAAEPMRRIAARTGVSESSLRRHASHVPETVALAARAEEATRADDLLSILRDGVRDAQRLRALAEDGGDLRGAIAALKTLADVVETLARVGERLAERESNLVTSPEWIALRTTMLDALEPYPEASDAIRAAIEAHKAGTVPKILVTLKLPSPA